MAARPRLPLSPTFDRDHECCLRAFDTCRARHFNPWAVPVRGHQASVHVSDSARSHSTARSADLLSGTPLGVLPRVVQRTQPLEVDAAAGERLTGWTHPVEVTGSRPGSDQRTVMLIASRGGARFLVGRFGHRPRQSGPESCGSRAPSGHAAMHTLLPARSARIQAAGAWELSTTTPPAATAAASRASA